MLVSGNLPMSSAEIASTMLPASGGGRVLREDRARQPERHGDRERQRAATAQVQIRQTFIFPARAGLRQLGHGVVPWFQKCSDSTTADRRQGGG